MEIDVGYMKEGKELKWRNWWKTFNFYCSTKKSYSFVSWIFIIFYGNIRACFQPKYDGTEIIRREFIHFHILLGILFGVLEFNIEIILPIWTTPEYVGWTRVAVLKHEQILKRQKEIIGAN